MKPETNNPQPAPEEKNKSPKLFESKGIVQYLRELSIVIIGVLITFMITGIINDYNRQKEIKGMMKLVREELEENREKLEQLQVRWDGEMDIWQLLQENIGDLGKIPEETFEKYDYAIGALYTYDFKNDSYDVLKSSMLMQYVKEKDLLRKLSRLYGSFANINRNLSTYSEQKSEVVRPMVEDMDVRESELWAKNIPFRFYSAMEDKGFKRFLPISNTILDEHIIQSTLQSIMELIREMEEMGY